jgi:hypothetical protein
MGPQRVIPLRSQRLVLQAQFRHFLAPEPFVWTKTAHPASRRQVPKTARIGHRSQRRLRVLLGSIDPPDNVV